MQSSNDKSSIEPDEVHVGLLSIVGTFSAVVLVLVVVLLQAWFYNWRGDIASSRVLAANSPETPLGRALLEQQEKIDTYRWINEKAGERAIPIGRAMELVAQEMAAQQNAVKKGH